MGLNLPILLAKSIPTKAQTKPQESVDTALKNVQQDLESISGQLLETTGSMHNFTQALNAAGFREYVDYMGSPWYSFWFNLLIGIARGLGFVIGATVVVTLVVWIISQILSQLPFVGAFFETLGEFLSEDNLEKLQSGEFLDTIDQLFNSFKANVLENTPPQ